MALRVLLVGLVASLGFELPTGQELSTWARSGRAWVEARAAGLSNLRLEAEQALAGLTDVERAEEPGPTIEMASTRADLLFEAAVEEMASDFAADLALMEHATPATEAVVVVERFEEMPPASPIGPEMGAPEPPSSPSLIVAPVVETSSTAEKLATAVRLTRQAVDAWASLIQATPVEVAGESRGDAF